MKVYVATEAKLFEPERYMFVKSSKKEVEKTLRKLSPHMRPIEATEKNVTTYMTDSSNQMLYFIHEEEI